MKTAILFVAAWFLVALASIGHDVISGVRSTQTFAACAATQPAAYQPAAYQPAANPTPCTPRPR